MTPGLLLPAALAALAAIVAPLVIHIARRSEERPIEFAALRWLRQKPRPKSRLRFDETLLLASRVLLLVLLAFWLAAPVLFGAASKAAWVAVAPGADISRAGQVGDEAVADYSRTHWLSPGFPALTEPTPAGAAPLASLLRQLDADLPADAPLVVVLPPVIDGADAERPRLSRRVDWRIVPGAAPAVRISRSAASTLRFRRSREPWSGSTPAACLPRSCAGSRRAAPPWSPRTRCSRKTPVGWRCGATRWIARWSRRSLWGPGA